MPLLSIVVPVHNEAAYIADLLPAMTNEIVDATGSPQELIVVENGSTDNTAQLANDLCEDLRTVGWKAEVISLPFPDYGAAMRAGFEQAHGDWVVNFDIDYFSGPFVAGLIATSADIVIASKRAPDSEDHRSLLRRSGTFGFNLLLRFLVGSKVTDTHGIKAFRRTVIDSMLTTVQSNKDLFDTELVIRSERAGFSIAEVPIIVEERRVARTPFLKRIPRTLKGLVQLRASFERERRNTRSR
jgi:glycosyltransferase involved in cell wall biosynthesis